MIRGSWLGILGFVEVLVGLDLSVGARFVFVGARSVFVRFESFQGFLLCFDFWVFCDLGFCLRLFFSIESLESFKVRS